MKDIVLILLTRIFVVLAGIISTRVFTSILTPEEAGRFNILLAICGWFGLVLIHPLSIFYNRMIIEWKGAGLLRIYIKKFINYVIIISIAGALIVYILNRVVDFKIEIDSLILSTIILLTVFSTGIYTSFSQFLNILGLRVKFAIISIVTVWLCLLFSVLFTIKYSSIAEYWLGGQILAYILVALIMFMIFFRIKEDSKKEDYSFLNFHSIYRVILPLIIVVLLYWGQSQGYRFIYQRITDLKTLGFFTVGFGIGSGIIAAFDIFFNQYYLPLYYNEISNAEDEVKRRSWNKYAFIYFPCLFIVLLYIVNTSPVIVKIITDRKYHGVSGAVIWGAVSETLRRIVNAFSIVSQTQLNMKPLILPYVSGTFVSFLCLFLFVPIDAFNGAGVSLSLGWLVTSIYVFFNMRKLLSINFPLKRIILAIFLTLPLFFIFFILKDFVLNMSLLKSVVLIIFASFYIVVVQWSLIKKYIHEISKGK